MNTNGKQQRERTILSHLFAWWLLGAIGGVFLQMELPPGVKLALRAETAVRDIAPYLCAGAVSGGLATLFLSFKRSAPRLSVVLLVSVCFALLSTVLERDLVGVTARLEARWPFLPWYGLLVGGATVVLLLPLFGAVLLPRRYRVVFCLFLAIAGAAANHSFIPHGYPGVHLGVGLASAVLLAVFIEGGWSSKWESWSRARVLVAVSALTFPSLFVVGAIQDDAIWSLRQQSVGAFLLPYLPARFVEHSVEISTASSNEWLKSRKHAPVRSPSIKRPQPIVDVVILLGIDALRADVVSSGRHDASLPVLGRLRDESLFFSEARSPASSTFSTIYSIFTGLYYSQTYWSRNDDNEKQFKRGHDIFPYFDKSPTFPQRLTDAGVQTTHVATMRSITGERGVDRGFNKRVSTRHFGRVEQAMTLILNELKKEPSRKTFLFSHFIDAHAPYNRGAKKGGQFVRYLSELQLIDQQLGRLVEYLEQSGLKERVLLILMADHGEAFGEHGTRYHAATIYDELVRVPLLFWGPSVKNRTLDTPVTLMDLGPTILDVFGQPIYGAMMGESLLPALLGDALRLSRPIAFDSSRRSQGMLFVDGTKLIVNLPKKTRELYDLSEDPGEQRNIFSKPGAGGPEKLAKVRAFFSTHRLDKKGYVAPRRKF